MKDKKRIIGLGDNVVDCYVNLGMMYPGGDALNVSVFAKQLGCDAAFLGVFGKDEKGAFIKSVLSELRIDCKRCREYEGENGFSRVKVENGERTFLGSNKGGVTHEYPIVLDDNDLKYLMTFDLVHSSIYSYISQELPKIKAQGTPISFDFSHRWSEEAFRLYCPNVDFGFLSCGKNTEEEAKSAIKMAVDLGCKIAVATMGEHGQILFDGRDYFFHEAIQITPRDTMGAGDAFISAFMVSFLKKNKFSPDVYNECLAYATQFATNNCFVDGSFGRGKPMEVKDE